MSDSETKEEKKPKAKAEVLNVKIVYDTNVIQFKVKSSTRMGKLMDAYCKQMRITKNDCRFLFDGTRISEDNNPGDLGIKDGDTIEVFVRQDGGAL